MAVLNVVKVGHPVLKQKAAPVEFVNKKIRALLDDMKDTMYAEDGVGLAAPQVGESIRMLVLDDGNGFQEFINPEILHASGEQVGVEGCLSVPGYFGDVKRYNELEVKYIDRNNKQRKIKAEGFLARILQHEMDHLDGILFIEKVEGPMSVETEQAKADGLISADDAAAEAANAALK